MQRDFDKTEKYKNFLCTSFIKISLIDRIHVSYIMHAKNTNKLR
jgi:hypothetical protein